MNVWGPAAVHSLGVVTRDWKYIFWPHAEEGFQPTEELYCVGRDRLEMNNLVADAESSDTLQTMRALYDNAVAAWKKQAVPYHGYTEFGVIFDRHLSWDKKRSLVKK
jgi:hypothetical protein